MALGRFTGGGGFIPLVSYNSATNAWVAAVVSNGGTVSVGRKSTVDDLIVGLKADGLWTKLDRLWILAAENTPSALTDMVALDLAVNNGATFTTDRGYTGVDSSAVNYVDTTYQPSTDAVQFAQNAAHASTWIVADFDGNTGSGGYVFGCADGSGETDMIYRLGSGFFRCNDASSGISYTTNSHGNWIIVRDSSTTTKVYGPTGTLFQSPSINSAALTTHPASILAVHSNGGISNGYGGQVAMQSFGGLFSSTDAGNFYSRLRTYMTAVGVP
jgi:hypothetical protein